MRYELSEIDVFSLGKIAGALYGAMGLFAWVFLPIFLLLPSGGGEEAVAKGITIFFLLAAPIVYAIMGFIMGLIAGLVYNLVSRSFGGLELTLSQGGA